MSFPAAECGAGAACATQTESACRMSQSVKGEERQRPLTGGRGGRSASKRNGRGIASADEPDPAYHMCDRE